MEDSLQAVSALFLNKDTLRSPKAATPLLRDGSAGTGGEDLFEFLLLPYTAIGIAMLLVLLLLLLRKVLRAREETCRRAEGIFEEPRGHHKDSPVNAISPAAGREARNELRRHGAVLHRRRHRR